MDGFQWDAGNIPHIARHDLTCSEVEEVICGEVLELDVQYDGDEERFPLVGKTPVEEYCLLSTRSAKA